MPIPGPSGANRDPAWDEFTIEPVSILAVGAGAWNLWSGFGWIVWKENNLNEGGLMRVLETEHLLLRHFSTGRPRCPVCSVQQRGSTAVHSRRHADI